MNKIDFKGSVVLNPVPVVLITSRNKEGKENVFTVGWTGTVCTRPPMLSISIRPERLSYEYITESMEFIVNLPSSKMVKALDYCGVKSGRKFDKIKDMDFSMKEGNMVNVPYIDDCPITIECKVKQIVKLGSHDMFIADVLSSHINENLLDENGKIHFEKANLISYSHGEYFKLPENNIGYFGFSLAKDSKKSPKEKIEYKNLNSVNKNRKKKTYNK
ncbi:flavin reductase family protein [Clostridium sp.]|uniref:flavin reductase family protein n=1 Tax=Clostridium sp. TaxID=1506 RepID=UPI0026321333|nr:flavin reductase family protein [Clostridium sp.]